MRTRLLAVLLTALTTVSLVTAPSTASTGGTPDGATHPAVGAIFAYTPTGLGWCSGSLISPTVLLTAAHCTVGTQGRYLVTFESVIADSPPLPFPVAADPSAGYTTEELSRAGYLAGTAYTHPAYSDFTDLDNWNDVGIIVLDKAVRDLTPMTLAEVGTLDAIPPKELRSTLFRSVGYGVVGRAPEGPQNPTWLDYPFMRRYVDMPFQKLMPQSVQTNGNEKDPFGTGGPAWGDSGGPLLLDGEIVGLTSYVNGYGYITGYQRVDISAAQTWIDRFLA